MCVQLVPTGTGHVIKLGVSLYAQLGNSELGSQKIQQQPL
jgi:hypothetical protein